MVYTITGPSSEGNAQFFFHLTPSEVEMLKILENDDHPSYADDPFLTFDEICSIIHQRISKILIDISKNDNHQLKCRLTKDDIVIRVLEDGNWLAIVQFQEITDIDYTGSNEKSIFTQILHGKGYADLNLDYLSEKELYEPNNAWTLWKFNEDISQWPPSLEYYPFITPQDYKEFEKNDDDLTRCLAAFKKDMPGFLRKRWVEEFESDIKKIEQSCCPIQTFNKCIQHPSSMSDAIIDDMFTALDDETANLLTEDTYTIIGYFYGIHFH